MRTFGKFLVVFGVVLSVQTALGQKDRDRGDRHSHDDNRPMSADEVTQRVARTEEFLKRLDTNNNGMIEESEANEGPGKYIMGRVFERMGTKPRYPISVSEIKQVTETYYRNRGNGSSSSGGSSGRSASSSGGSSSTPQPSSGFGSANSSQPSSMSFGGSSGATKPISGSGSSSFSSSGKEPLDPAIEQKIRALAAAIVHRYDKNGDSKLDRDEWPSHGRWGSFDEANRHGGNHVVADELIIHLTDWYRRQMVSLDAPDLGVTSGGFDSTKPGMRKTIRFLTAKERLPKGLPDWFLEKADADGQVTMASFAKNWTPDAAAEFDRYDLNRDGIITAVECLKVEKQRSSSK